MWAWRRPGTGSRLLEWSRERGHYVFPVPPQGQRSIPPHFQPDRPLRARNRERKAKDSSRHPLCPRSPPCISTQRPATSPLYQVCFLQFCPLGRHDGGGQSVLKFPTSPRWAPVTRPLSYADYRPRQGQDDHLLVCGTAEVTMPRAHMPAGRVTAALSLGGLGY